MISASVIIPNWNGQELLPKCLGSLKNQTFKNFEVVVVDNGSTDSSIELVENKFPEVKLIKLDRNYGFAKACNEGVKKSKANYIVFLNNDAEVDKKWLKELIRVADNHPEVVSVNPKVLNLDDRRLIDGVGILINEVGQAKSIGYNEVDRGQYEREMYIFGATGGASLFRRDIFVKLGMFDEDYFMYFEEVDFAFRAQFAGYKSLYTPRAIVYHKHKASSRRTPQKIEYWQFRNMTQTIIKDFPGELILRKWRWLKIIMVHFNTIFYQVKNGFYWPPVLTELWLIVHLPTILSKRVEVQSRRGVSDNYIEKFFVNKKISFWGLKK